MKAIRSVILLAIVAASLAAGLTPAAAIRCADGTTSNALHTQGACSHHGGIADVGGGSSIPAVPPSAGAVPGTLLATNDAICSAIVSTPHIAVMICRPPTIAPGVWQTAMLATPVTLTDMPRAAAPARHHRRHGRGSSAPSHGSATALCNDGTPSYSTTHSGTCSGHGGVATWYH